MNVFNRIVTIFVLVVALLIVLALAVFPLDLIRAAQGSLNSIGATFAALQSAYFWPYMVVRVLVVLLGIALFGLLIWREIKPSAPGAVDVVTEGGSQAKVTTDSVARRLAWHIDQLPDVVSVTPHVWGRGQKVNVVLDLQTSPEIDVPAKTDEVVKVARSVIGERMGLQIGRVEVRIEHAPYEEVEEAGNGWAQE